MDIIFAVLLVLCAGFAGLEAVTIGMAAQSAMHQIYAALWGVAFVCALAGLGVISAVRGAAKRLDDQIDRVIAVQVKCIPRRDEPQEENLTPPAP